MNGRKYFGKISIGLMAALWACGLSISSLAASSSQGTVAVTLLEDQAGLVNFEGTVKALSKQATEDAGEYAFSVTPGQTLYLNLGKMEEATSVLRKASDEGELNLLPVKAGELGNAERFQLDVEKTGEGAGLVSLAQYNDASLGDSERNAWLQVVVANTTATEDVDAKCAVRLVAKADDSQEPMRYKAEDYATLSLALQIQAPKKEREKGRFLDTPDAAPDGKNEASWENVAILSASGSQKPGFEGIRLSTEGDELVFKKLRERDGTELFFRSFSGTLSIKPGERITLTLKNPWVTTEGEKNPNPEDCRIYQWDANGNITDITALFTYTATGSDGSEVNGWQMKTGCLASYVISNKPLL